MKRIILYINMLLISTTFANANTVDEIMESIKTNNFSLKASEEATKSSIQTIKSTNRLNDPQVGFEYHEGANVDGNKYGLSVSQSFSWPGLYITRSKANKLKISIEESNLLAKRLDVLLNAKQLCIQIINYNKKINSQTAVYENISQLYTEYEKGYKHGEISILDINKLKIELLNTKRVLDEFSAQRTILIEELCALNGNKSVDFICNITDYPVQTIESIDTYLAQISTLDPEYLASKQNVNAKSKDISISKMGWLPEFSLGYNYSNEMGTKFNGVSVGISIPIFSNKNKVGASKAEFTSAEMSQKDILINKEQSLKAIYAHAVTINYQIHSYKNVLDNGSNQEMLKKALNGGQISLLDYLLELRYFLEAQQTLLDLEFEYNTQLTDLNKYNLL